MLLVPKKGNLERHLRPFVFLPDHHRRHHSWPHHLHFLSVVRKGEVELPDKCNQKRMQFDDAVSGKRPVNQFIRFYFAFGRGEMKLTRTAIRCNSCGLRRR